jgi:hypothetical protein
MAKLTIGSIDDIDLTVRAQYNPKEIDLQKQVTWKEENAIKGRAPKDEYDVYDLEYTGLPARTMSLELLFDGYEDNKSVQPTILALQQMMTPIDEHSTDSHLARPHHCVVAWGDRDLVNFQCVIESLSVKYTVFGTDGRMLRAVCNVKLKESRYRRAVRRELQRR